MKVLNTLRRNGWNAGHLVALLVLLAAGLIVTWDAWKDIFTKAMRDEESSHILLVPIVAVWLVWVRRARLRQCRPVGTWAGPVVVALGWLVSWYGYNNSHQSLWHGGSLLVMLGCFVTVAGLPVVRALAPAFIVLVFLVPVPGMVRQRIAIPLQTATAEVTHQVFEVAGMDVPRSGNLLSINGVEVGIAEACNGMRMVFALVLVSYAFAFSSPLRWYVRGIILLASPISAIACNVGRLIPTVWLHGYASRQTADTFHNVSGWAMLVVAFLLLFAILRALRWALVPLTRYTLAYD